MKYDNWVKIEDLDKLLNFGFEKKDNHYFYTVTANPKTGKPYSKRKWYPTLEVDENGDLRYHVGSKLNTKYFNEIITKLKDAEILQPAYNILKGEYVW